jgi:hypothetical protein
MPFQKGHKPYGNVFKKGQSGNPGGLPAGIERDEEAEFLSRRKNRRVSCPAQDDDAQGRALG